MMLKFYKYQGAGNDFIIIDNRKASLSKPGPKIISDLCNRRFGIGADGLILLQQKEGFDFEMIYFNADGKIGSMCGNGGRCIVAFAKKLGIVGDNCKFHAADGEHLANVISTDSVELKMNEAKDIGLSETDCHIDTGSPHHICFVENADKIDVLKAGQAIRYSEKYKAKGVNVNFVEIIGQDQLKVFTYERGVEEETLACGTGVTAAALAYFLQKTDKLTGTHVVNIHAKGGNLSVKFKYSDNKFNDIWLCGPAKFVFDGEINLEI
jgi:diaminopimelate epimerase